MKQALIQTIEDEVFRFERTEPATRRASASRASDSASGRFQNT